MYNYATNSNFKSEVDVKTSQFAKNAYFASWKSDVDKLDIDQLDTTAIDLSKLNNVVKNVVARMAVYDGLVKKKLILFRLLILVISLKKLTPTQSLKKLKRK